MFWKGWSNIRWGLEWDMFWKRWSNIRWGLEGGRVLGEVE